jgi:hypothetical protein
MRRVHLFEFGDLPWWPAAIRDCVTDSLAFGIARMGLYAKAAPLVADLLARGGTRDVVDLCAGGAGPWPGLRDALGPDVRVTLTDRQPNAAAVARVAALADPRVRYLAHPVDAAAVPPELVGVRTIFTAFHHLTPTAAARVLADAAAAGAPIGVFEFTERAWPSYLAAALVPWSMLFTTPWIRPFRLARLLFTYALPLAPLCNLWDGLVSSLRTYTPAEMLALARGAAPGYRWEAGTLRGRGPAVTYLVGWRPTTAAGIGGAPRLPPQGPSDSSPRAAVTPR